MIQANMILLAYFDTYSGYTKKCVTADALGLSVISTKLYRERECYTNVSVRCPTGEAQLSSLPAHAALGVRNRRQL